MVSRSIGPLARLGLRRQAGHRPAPGARRRHLPARLDGVGVRRGVLVQRRRRDLRTRAAPLVAGRARGVLARRPPVALAPVSRGASAGDGEPHDWVTRAADDAVRQRRRAAPPRHGLVGRQPVGSGAPRQPARVPHRALRRRGAPAPRRSPPGTCTCGTTTTGSARSPSASTRRGASTSAGRSRRSRTPTGCHDSWAEHFKQPLRDALHAMGVDMDEVSQTERYEAGHYRDAVLTAVAARDAIEAVLARHRTKAADARAGERAGGRSARRLGRRRRRRRAARRR